MPLRPKKPWFARASSVRAVFPISTSWNGRISNGNSQPKIHDATMSLAKPLGSWMKRNQL
jgi:hypothetical protein